MLLLHAWTPVWTDSLNKTLMLEPFVLNSVPQISYEPMDQHLVCRINGKQYLSENNRKGLSRRIFIRVFPLNLYIYWGALAKEGGGKMDFVVKKNPETSDEDICYWENLFPYPRVLRLEKYYDVVFHHFPDNVEQLYFFLNQEEFK